MQKKFKQLEAELINIQEHYLQIKHLKSELQRLKEIEWRVDPYSSECLPIADWNLGREEDYDPA